MRQMAYVSESTSSSGVRMAYILRKRPFFIFSLRALFVGELFEKLDVSCVPGSSV